jgi:hypothetical protein
LKSLATGGQGAWRLVALSDVGLAQYESVFPTDWKIVAAALLGQVYMQVLELEMLAAPGALNKASDFGMEDGFNSLVDLVEGISSSDAVSLKCLLNKPLRAIISNCPEVRSRKRRLTRADR